MNNLFTYSGISFPPRKAGTSGFFAMATDEELLRESIYVILNTRKGEMPMNADFGTSIDSSLFDSMNPTMQGVVCQQIKQDIETWEPRVAVKSITAYSYEHTRLFNVILQIKSTGRQFSSSVPFNG